MTRKCRKSNPNNLDLDHFMNWDNFPFKAKELLWERAKIPMILGAIIYYLTRDFFPSNAFYLQKIHI